VAVIFMDGFDHYATADLPKRWTSSTAAAVGASYARFPSGQGVLTSSGSNCQIFRSFGANYTAGLFGFAFQIPSGSMASKVVAVIYDGVTEQCRVATNASSVLTVSQAATLKETGSTVLSAATWYFVEFKFTIHNSTGIAQVKLNGAAEIASTGSLDLTGTANNYWNGISLASAASGLAAYYDDIYLLDTTTGDNVDFLGPVRCVALAPAAPGTTTAWTPNGGTNYGCVSEAYQDGDGTFNQSSTADQVDTFVMQDLPADAGSVYAVQSIITARQDAGAARTIAPVLRPAATDRVGTTVALSTSYQMLTQIYDLNPEDSAAWATADVASLEVGYKLVS
jgi:hypothetical protein